jgi:2'-5' RNA ligase
MGRQAWVSLTLKEDTRDALILLANNVHEASPVALDTMKRDDLHMTLAFLGVLKKPTPVQKTALETAMAVFGSSVTSATLIGLELFPPGKQNLLIARFDIDKAGLARVRELQRACHAVGLVNKEEWERILVTPFVAHITLGKFRGMRADQLAGVAASVASIVIPDAWNIPFSSCHLAS